MNAPLILYTIKVNNYNEYYSKQLFITFYIHKVWCFVFENPQLNTAIKIYMYIHVKRRYIYLFRLNNYCSLEIIESIEDTANSRAAFQALIKDPKYNISDSFDANIVSERYLIHVINLA